MHVRNEADARSHISDKYAGTPMMLSRAARVEIRRVVAAGAI